MLIVYCEKCTLRIPASELENCTAVQTAENKYLCATCAAAAGVTASKTSGRKSTSANVISEEHSSAPPTVPMMAAIGGEASKSKVMRAPTRSGTMRPATGSMSPADTSTRHSTAGLHPPVKNSPPVALIAGGVATVFVLILLFAMSGGSESKEKKVAATETPSRQNTVSITPPVVPPVLPVRREDPLRSAPPIDESRKALPDAQPQREADKPATTQAGGDNRNEPDVRTETAAKRLEEAKEFNKNQPDDPWTYGEKLDAIIKSYRGTASAEEASTLLTELDLASIGARPTAPKAAGSEWYKDWTFKETRGTIQTDEVAGKRLVVKTQSKTNKSTARISKMMAVSADKPVLFFAVRSNEKGDFEFGLEVDKQRALTEKLGGGKWQTIAVNLAPYAGREVEIVLINKPIGEYNNEWSYFTEPKFAATAPDGVNKLLEMKGEVAVAKANVPPPPPPPPPPPATKKDEKVPVPPTPPKPADPVKDNPFANSETPEKAPPSVAIKAPEPKTPFEAAAANVPLNADYERLMTDVYTAIVKQDLTAARTALGEARGNFKFLSLTQTLEIDADTIGYAEVINKAVLDGLNAAIASKPALKLRRSKDGKEIQLSKVTVISAVKDGVISIDQDQRGAKTTHQWDVAQLSWQTRYDLAKAALPAGPETTAQLAFAGIMALFADGEPNSEPTPDTTRRHIEALKKAEGMAEKADHLKARLTRMEKDLLAGKAIDEIDKLIAAGMKREALEMIEKFRADYAGTRALQRHDAHLNFRLSNLK